MNERPVEDIEGVNFLPRGYQGGERETESEAGIFTPWISTGVGGKREKTQSFSNKKDFVAKFF